MVRRWNVNCVLMGVVTPRASWPQESWGKLAQRTRRRTRMRRVVNIHNIHCGPREEKWRPTLQAIRPWTRQNPSSESRQACGTVVASAAKGQAIMFTSQVSKVWKDERRRIGQKCPGRSEGEWLRIEYHRKFGAAPPPAAIHDGRTCPQRGLRSRFHFSTLPRLTSRWSTQSSPGRPRWWGGSWWTWTRWAWWCLGGSTPWPGAHWGLVNEAAARGLTPLQLPSASGHPPPPT